MRTGPEQEASSWVEEPAQQRCPPRARKRLKKGAWWKNSAPMRLVGSCTFVGPLLIASLPFESQIGATVSGSTSSFILGHRLRELLSPVLSDLRELLFHELLGRADLVCSPGMRWTSRTRSCSFIMASPHWRSCRTLPKTETILRRS